MKRDVIDTLSLHFGCLEERVTCARVKRFLPGLLMPSAQIRIPTPITVHIDHCPECADDLKALRDLGLTAEQLERLEQLYGCESFGTSPSNGPRASSVWPALVSSRHRLREALRCRRARARVSAFVHGRLEDIDAEILNHLCTCPRCRPRVYHSRQTLLAGQPKGTIETPAICDEGTSIAQLFDYAVPYGRTTDGQDWAGDSHVGTCHACLRRIQELDETVYGIAERTDSGVATVYSTAEGDAPPQDIVPMHDGISSGNSIAEAQAGPVASSFTDVYPDYPIRVQVIRGRPQFIAAVAAWKRTAFDPRVRFLLKTAVAAAAMIPLTILFLNTSPASGTTLAQVCKAFGKAQNVHVARFYPNTGQITQELWVSRTSDCVLMGRGQERTLYNLSEKKSGGSTMRIGDTKDSSKPQDVAVQRIIDTCLGFTPRDIPPSARWVRLSDNVEGSEIYELTYTELGQSGGALSRRLEITIDPITRLPREVRVFRKTPVEKEWHYLTRIECRYLTEDEMAAVMKSH